VPKGGDMDKNRSPPPLVTELDAEPSSPRAQIEGLANDVRALAEAEWEYARARISYSGGVVRKAGLFALLAILSLSGAAIALILGILLILAHYLGPWAATAITVLLFALAAYVFALRARATARNLSFSEADSND
jgi:Putative Actinobacterial Holin-X, holin superfamily III